MSLEKPYKIHLDFNPLKCHSLGFPVFRTGYLPSFNINNWKIYCYFKKLSIFESLTDLGKTVETALDPRLGRYFFPVLAPAVEKRNSHRLMTIIVMVIQYGAPTIR